MSLPPFGLPERLFVERGQDRAAIRDEDREHARWCWLSRSLDDATPPSGSCESAWRIMPPHGRGWRIARRQRQSDGRNSAQRDEHLSRLDCLREGLGGCLNGMRNPWRGADESGPARGVHHLLAGSDTAQAGFARLAGISPLVRAPGSQPHLAALSWSAAWPSAPFSRRRGWHRRCGSSTPPTRDRAFLYHVYWLTQ
jgi:hypothetical protein